MKYYIDENNIVYALEAALDPAVWIPVTVKEIGEKEALLIANPPPTKQQLVEQTEEKKQFLISEVHTETEILRAKLALKRIKPDEEALLIAWFDYLDLLEAIDTSLAPDITWPQKPQ